MEMMEEAKVIKISSPYIEAFSFEVYDVVGAVETWRKFRPLLYLIVVAYLAGIYFGQKWMKDRPAFDLKITLFFWNLSLAIFSLATALRTGPEFIYLLSQPDGTHLLLCTGHIHNFATSFWMYLMMLSKILELGDTVFIILRKQPLILLHWFHHVATLIIFWFGFEQYDTRGRVFVLNAFVHFFMYSYYALKALGVKIPARIAKVLTILQIIQLLCFIYLGLSAAIFEAQGRPCRSSVQLTYIGLVITSIFVILFVQFFIQRYFGKKNKVTSKSE